MELAKTPQIDTAKLKQRLFTDSNAVCKADKDPAWAVEVWPAGAEPCSFSAWLQACCDCQRAADILPAALALAARRIMAVIRAEEQGDIRHAG